MKKNSATVSKGLQKNTIIDFILYTLYYFNVKFVISAKTSMEDVSELTNILESIETTFGKKIRAQCESIIRVNECCESRVAQNKAIKKSLELPLQTGATSQNTYVFVTRHDAKTARQIVIFLNSLKPGTDINQKHALPSVLPRKFTLIDVACGLNSPYLLQALVHQGGDFKIHKKNESLLQLCVQRDSFDTMKWLFDNGYVCKEEEALAHLLYIDTMDHMSTSSFELLLKNNLTISSELESTTVDRSKNPLFILNVVKRICAKGEPESWLRVLEVLLRKGYRADGIDEFGETVLSYAVNFESYKVVQLLMRNAKKSVAVVVNHVSLSGCTVLTKVITQGLEDIAKQLLALGATPNLPSVKVHLLPLSVANYLKCESMVTLLKEKGAEECPFNPTLTCVRSDTLEVATQRTLIFAICSRNLKLTRRLLSVGESPNFLKVDFRAPLYYAMVSYKEAINADQKEMSMRIFEELMKVDVAVTLSLFHDYYLPPLHFSMKHDLSVFIAPLISARKDSPIIDNEAVDLITIACSENSVESFKEYLRSNGRFSNDYREIIGFLSQLSTHCFYEMAKELIVQLGVKAIPAEEKQKLFKVFTIRFVWLTEAEQLVYKNRLLAMLNYFSWFIGLPDKISYVFEAWDKDRIDYTCQIFNTVILGEEEGKIVDAKADKFSRDILLEMAVVQRSQALARTHILDKLISYCKHHSIKAQWLFENNILKVMGELSKIKILDDLKALGVIVRAMTGNTVAGLFFPFPDKEFMGRFNCLFTASDYLHYETKPESGITFGEKLFQISTAALSNKADTSRFSCLNGLIDQHHPDIVHIKYSEDKVVLLSAILEPQGCTPHYLQKLKTVNNLGSKTPELIARLEGIPLFQEVKLDNGNTQTVQLTHRLTIHLGKGDNYCSVALGAVISDDQQHIIYIGLLLVNNSLSKLEHLAELAEKCKEPLSLTSNMVGHYASPQIN